MLPTSIPCPNISVQTDNIQMLPLKIKLPHNIHVTKNQPLFSYCTAIQLQQANL